MKTLPYGRLAPGSFCPDTVALRLAVLSRAARVMGVVEPGQPVQGRALGPQRGPARLRLQGPALHQKAAATTEVVKAMLAAIATPWQVARDRALVARPERGCPTTGRGPCTHRHSGHHGGGRPPDQSCPPDDAETGRDGSPPGSVAASALTMPGRGTPPRSPPRRRRPRARARPAPSRCSGFGRRG